MTDAKAIEIPADHRRTFAMQGYNPDEFEARAFKFKIKGTSFGLAEKALDDEGFVDQLMQTFDYALGILGIDTEITKLQVELVEE